MARGRRRGRSAVVVVLSIVGLIASTLGHGAASAGRQQGIPGEAASSATHAATGRISFISTEPGRPIPRPDGLSPDAPPETIARAFLAQYGQAFGLRDERSELRVEASRQVEGGRSVVRFQQLHRGVPVLGGELVVNLDRGGNVLSANGEVLPAPGIAVAPQVAASEARQTARAAVARSADISASDIESARPTLWVHDPRILGGPGLRIPRLVWRLDVADGGLVDEMVLVDAELGNVVLTIDNIQHARDRRVCDANSTSTQLPCTSPVRTEGGPAHAVQDVNDAYDFSGDTYDFFFDNFGRDSLDGAGMTLYSTVRYCPDPGNCPFQNAFWDGSQMVYGAGFAVDDVVGHELMHGVTNFTSRLFYYYQSGAINESLSDVFGEFVDLTNGAGTDTTGVRWLLGEDIPGIGAVRDMANPPAFGHPDRMMSPNYTADSNEVDGGGVHTNSGVNNKAAFLITDGGSFNGQTITGLGISKAARIYYEVAANLLTSASDYADLALALPQACATLAGTGGITSGDCSEVSKAVAAVEMAELPPSAPNPEAPVCPAGAPKTDLFLDDLENTSSGNWTLQTTSGVNEWYYPQTASPYSFDATYATSGATNFWGYNRSGVSDYSIAMTSDLAVPAGSQAYLRFRHAFGFEDDATNAYDGGVLEYSTNGGSTWSDAGGLFTHQGYSGTIAAAFGNPLAGRSAFVRESNGYISSRVGLSSLAGGSVRFRFRIGTDSVFDDFGWFVDDVNVYMCGSGGTTPPDTAPPDTTITKGPKKKIVTAKKRVRVRFVFVSSEAGSTFRCKLDKGAWKACSSPKAYRVKPGRHTFRVAAIDQLLNVDPSPAVRRFRIVRRS